MKKAPVNVLIPIYKNYLSESEILSLRFVFYYLKKYPITIIVPENLGKIHDLDYSSINIEKFPRKYFEGLDGYNQLLLSIDFYRRFIQFEYVLIYQLDALVFKDNLYTWLNKDFDYVGAPWINESKRIFMNIFLKVSPITAIKIFLTQRLNYSVGNGGLSLRKVGSCIQAIENNKKLIRKWKANEDYFWSFCAKANGKVFSKPSFEEAIQFSIETEATIAFKYLKDDLPFGTHAWEKENNSYWLSKIQGKLESFKKMQDDVNQPTFSIITVTYNCKQLLPKTIESIKNQNYPNLEYIVIDGNSTDGTLDVIKANSEHITKWVSEPDNGIYDAMNKGMQIATGNYVWFINAGDEIYMPDTIEKMFASHPNADVFYGDTLIVDEKGNAVGPRRLRPPENLTWRSFQMGQLVSHQAFVAKRELVPLYDLTYKHSADTDWQIKILKHSNQIVNTHQILCKFLDWGKSKHNIIPSLKERFHIMIKNYGLTKTVFNHFVISFKFLRYLFRFGRF